MKLRLYHHSDGARVAYRESGTGPPLALLHSRMLTHREWEPVVGVLAERFRLVLPDLPLHGDSEDRPRHPYTPEWLTDVLAGFCRDTLGPRPLIAGHGLGAELLLRAIITDRIRPARMVLMPNRMHGRTPRPAATRVWRAATRAAALPGLDRGLAYGAARVIRPALGEKLTVGRDTGARDLVRHAFSDVGGNGNRARSWAKFARAWPLAAQEQLLDDYARLTVPTLLLWADADPFHPLALAEEAERRMPDAQLRVLPDTGFLIAYDDPVGVGRELSAFLG